MTRMSATTDRLALRGLAYELTDEEMDLVTGGDEKQPQECHWKATTTDINGDRTNDDCDI